jgi:type IV secretion system protein VirB10
MSNDTPNSLAPVKNVGVTRMSKWPLYAFLLCSLILGGALVYSVNFAHNQEGEQAGTPTVDIREDTRPLVMGEGRGLALPANAPATAQAETGTDRAEPLIVVRDSGRQEPDQYQRELENMRRMWAQAQIAALSAPLGVHRATASAQAAPAVQAERRDFGREAVFDPASLREGSYDPAAARDREAFFSRAERDESWILPHGRVAGQPLEIKTGAVIPSVMVTGINSDLPGNIIAQVSQNVWDTATGRNLLIPQGSRLFGVYDSRVVYGQSRVLVAWNRVIFPDGSAITLGAMPGADMAGYAGYTDQVNNHYMRIFGSAVLMSLIGGGMAYTMDSINSSTGTDAAPSIQDEMAAALAAQLGQTTMQLIQKNLNISPTLEVRPGYQFNIIVTQDMVFQKPYTAGR